MAEVLTKNPNDRRNASNDPRAKKIDKTLVESEGTRACGTVDL